MSMNAHGPTQHVLSRLVGLFDLHPAAIIERWTVQAARRRSEREMVRVLGPRLLRDVGALEIPQDGTAPLLSPKAQARLTPITTFQYPLDELDRTASSRTGVERTSSFSGARFWIWPGAI